MSSRQRNGRGRSRKSKSNPNNARSLELLRIERAQMLLQEENAGTFLPAVRDVVPLPMSRVDTCIFSRSYTYGTITTSGVAGSPSFTAISVSLSNLSNSTEFTTLFDNYRFLQMQFTFMPVAGASTANVGGYYGAFYTAIDTDDTNIPSSLSTLQEYNTCRVVQTGKAFTRVFTPRAAIPVYVNSAVSGYSQMPVGSWCDAASPGINYYGLKVGIAASSGTSVPVYTLDIKVILQCKLVR